MGKKPKPQTMSLAEVNEKFGGSNDAALPSRSFGKEFGKGDFGKGKGKGRDFDDSRADAGGDWRGGGKDGGGKGGRRREEPESRADQEDCWRSKDRPAGGGDDRRGGFGGGGFGDRGDRRGGGMGDRDRERGGDRFGDRDRGDRRGDRADDSAAAQDGDWRSGPRSAARDDDRQRDNRDRDEGRRSSAFGRRGDDDKDWGRGGARDEAPSQRPRLNLKPRTIDKPAGEAPKDTAQVKEGASKMGMAPWKKNREEPKADDDVKKDEVDDDGFTSVTKSTKSSGTRYVPPNLRVQKEPAKPAPQPVEEDDDDDDSEEEDEKPAKKTVAADDDDDDDDDDDSEDEEEEAEEEPPAKVEKPKKDEEKPAQKWVPPSQKKKIEEEERERPKQPSRREADEGTARRTGREAEAKEGLESLSKSTSGGGGKYVPAHLRKAEEEKRKKEEDAARKEREEQEAKQAAKQEAERKKQAEREKKKEDEKKAREAKKAEAATKKPKDEQKNVVSSVEPGFNEERLSAFTEKCGEAIADIDVDVNDVVDEVPSILSDEELHSIQPTSRLLQSLLMFCRRKEDQVVVDVVERFAPLLNCLIDSAQMRRFKIKFLREAQRLAFEMGLPRLSPASALLEVFFDSLYRSEVIEEKYFDLWAEDRFDDTPGKTKAMFQLSDFLDFLRNAPVEGETSEEEDEGDKDKEDDDDDDEEEENDESDDDIEANVPKRQGVRPMVR